MYAPGKTAEQCAAIVAELLAEPGGGPVLLTRADDEQAEAALARNPGGVAHRHHRSCGGRPTTRPARVLVITAGTADLPVADECLATLRAFGIPAPPASPTAASPASTGCWPSVDELDDADAVVVVAGMEGALATPRRRHRRRRRSSRCRPAWATAPPSRA